MVQLKPRLTSARLYGILDLGYVSEADAPGILAKMLDGGVDIVQLRGKGVPPSKISALASRLAPLCRKHQVPFLLNDHPELVQETGADGVHVGQDDLDLDTARKLAGPAALIGKSTHSLAQAVAAQQEGADYIGFGPLFATPTKPDYLPIGLDEISEAHRKVGRPIFCIGGIKRENLTQILSAGATRFVIVSGILTAQDPSRYCRECLSIADEAATQQQAQQQQ